jgi:nucleoside-diphosphate-sugar epimerase
MSVLITGATGFVGASLVRRCLDRGREVHVIVRAGANTWRIDDIRTRVRQHEGDLLDADRVRAIVAAVRPSAICHLATHGGFAAQQDTRAIFETNIFGTMNLLRACETTDFDCFVNTGSSSEYGIANRPMEESDRIEPRGDYAVSKATSTLFCTSEAVEKGLPVMTLRLFSPYGPWDDGRRMVPYVVSSLLRGEAPQLSSPRHVRDYVYIEDVLDAYERAMAAPLSGTVFNIGSGMQYTIGDVVDRIGAAVPGSVAPIWGARGPQRNEPAVWAANIEKARAQLGWEPRTSLPEGIARTVAWFRDHGHRYQEHQA